MSSKYNPKDPWPLPVLAKYAEVREYKGFHIIYTNGITRDKTYNIELQKLGEIPDGWTVRVFMFRTDTSGDQQSTPNTRPFVQSVAAQNDDTEERSHLQTFPPVAVLKDMFFDILTRLTGMGGGNSADLWTLGNLYLRSGGWYEVCRQLLNNVNHFELWLYIKVGEKLR
ncbi:hypothetical protein MTO96_028138 [Rhipicephalus appendiculatus]